MFQIKFESRMNYNEIHNFITLLNSKMKNSILLIKIAHFLTIIIIHITQLRSTKCAIIAIFDIVYRIIVIIIRETIRIRSSSRGVTPSMQCMNLTTLSRL